MPSWGVLAVVAVRAMPARVALSPLTNAGQAPIANRVMTCLVQQSYNTTSTNGIPPAHTTGRRTGPDSLVQQGER